LDYLPDTPANKEFIAKVKPVFERYKNIGVRIEDDMLVTETGVEWMTKALPREINQVQAFMERAKAEMQTAEVEKILNPTFAVLNNNRLNDLNFQVGLNYPRGKTVRQGWIWSGKETANSGLSHAGH
jgi:hypothetical protein